MFRILLVVSYLICTNASSQISQEWAVRYNNWTQNGNDTAVAMVLDDSSNVYVTGVSAGTNGYMDYLTIKYSNSGVPIWTQRFNGAGNWHDFVNAMAIDDSGNVYVTGTSFGGGFTPTNNYLTIKYNRAGVQQWIEEFDRAVNYDEATAITTDDSGYVYVTGYAVGGTQEDFFTIKYDFNGNIIWTTAFNGASNLVDIPIRIALDSAYNVYVAGSAFQTNMTMDFATVKYNSNGVQQWAKFYHGNANGNGAWDYITDMKVTPGGTVYVVGIGGNYNFDPWTTIKYDTYGNQKWLRKWSASNTYNYFETPHALVVDSAENIYTTGSEDVTNMHACVTMKYDSSGTQQWVRYYTYLTVNVLDVGRAICLDLQGNIYVAGNSPSNLSGGNHDYFTIKYDPSGTLQWNIRYNGLGNQMDRAGVVLVDSVGSIYITGYSYGGGTGNDYATVKYSYITGQEELALGSWLQLAPNPSDGHFTVLTNQTQFQLMIYSAEGRLVKSQANDRNLDITSEPDGIYFVHLYDSEGKVQVQKLVKTSAE